MTEVPGSDIEAGVDAVQDGNEVLSGPDSSAVQQATDQKVDDLADDIDVMDAYALVTELNVDPVNSSDYRTAVETGVVPDSGGYKQFLQREGKLDADPQFEQNAKDFVNKELRDPANDFSYQNQATEARRLLNDPAVQGQLTQEQLQEFNLQFSGLQNEHFGVIGSIEGETQNWGVAKHQARNVRRGLDNLLASLQEATESEVQFSGDNQESVPRDISGSLAYEMDQLIDLDEGPVGAPAENVIAPDTVEPSTATEQVASAPEPQRESLLKSAGDVIGEALDTGNEGIGLTNVIEMGDDLDESVVRAVDSNVTEFLEAWQQNREQLNAGIDNLEKGLANATVAAKEKLFNGSVNESGENAKEYAGALMDEYVWQNVAYLDSQFTSLQEMGGTAFAKAGEALGDVGGDMQESLARQQAEFEEQFAQLSREFEEFKNVATVAAAETAVALGAYYNETMKPTVDSAVATTDKAGTLIAEGDVIGMTLQTLGGGVDALTKEWDASNERYDAFVENQTEEREAAVQLAVEEASQRLADAKDALLNGAFKDAGANFEEYASALFHNQTDGLATRMSTEWNDFWERQDKNSEEWTNILSEGGEGLSDSAAQALQEAKQAWDDFKQEGGNFIDNAVAMGEVVKDDALSAVGNLTNAAVAKSVEVAKDLQPAMESGSEALSAAGDVKDVALGSFQKVGGDVLSAVTEAGEKGLQDIAAASDDMAAERLAASVAVERGVEAQKAWGDLMNGSLRESGTNLLTFAKTGGAALKDPAIAYIGGQINETMDPIEQAVSSAGDVLSAGYDAAGESISDVGDQISKAGSRLKSAASEFKNDAVASASSVIDRVTPDINVSNAMDTATTYGKFLKQDLARAYIPRGIRAWWNR